MDIIVKKICDYVRRQVYIVKKITYGDKYNQVIEKVIFGVYNSEEKAIKEIKEHEKIIYITETISEEEHNKRRYQEKNVIEDELNSLSRDENHYHYYKIKSKDYIAISKTEWGPLYQSYRDGLIRIHRTKILYRISIHNVK